MVTTGTRSPLTGAARLPRSMLPDRSPRSMFATVAADIGRNGCAARTVAALPDACRNWRTADRRRGRSPDACRTSGGTACADCVANGRGRLAKRTARFRRARTWAARRTACKAVFGAIAAKRRGTGANPSGAEKRKGGRLRRVSGDCGGERLPLTGGARSNGCGLPDRLTGGARSNGCRVRRIDWRTVAAESGAAFDVRHGRTVEPLTGRNGCTVATSPDGLR